MRSVPILIIGGGAAGMMAAVSALDMGGRVLLIDKMNQLGKKLLATGNGRCNFTNLNQKAEYYHVKDSDEVWNVFQRFDEKKTMAFFKDAGVYPVDKAGYVYPMSMQASSLRNCLQRRMDGVQVHLEEEVIDISQKISATGKSTGFIVTTTKDKYLAKKIVVSAGGMAAKCHGSDGACFSILKKLGHTIVAPVPALTWFKINQSYTKLWAGARVKGCIKAFDESGKMLAKDLGELQLVATGISGIPVFQVSRYVSREIYNMRKPYVEVEFLPELTYDEILSEIYKRRNYNQQMEVSFVLEGIMNDKLVNAILCKAGIKRTLLLKDITEKQCEIICKSIKCFRADVEETAGFDNAQVTSGGVKKSEINFDTMSSKIFEGLYFAGEIVDVDGICGGYNLQWAWSSGYIAGISAAGGKAE